MKAMIFAAGIGSRLKPWTDSHPKALAPLGGLPILGHVIEKLRREGVTRIVVNVHHFADQVKHYLATSPLCSGLDIAISDESSLLLDTGGGLLAARHLLDDGTPEPILLHNADIYTSFPLSEMLAAHLRPLPPSLLHPSVCESHWGADAQKRVPTSGRPSLAGLHCAEGESPRSAMSRPSADVTLLVAPRASSRQLYFSPSTMELCGWQNLSTSATLPTGFTPTTELPLAFGGVHIVSPTIFPHLEAYARTAGPAFSITPFYLSLLSAPVPVPSLRIQGYTPSAPFLWHDIGTPAKLAAAEASLAHSILQ